jgi:hypothetical protein
MRAYISQHNAPVYLHSLPNSLLNAIDQALYNLVNEGRPIDIQYEVTLKSDHYEVTCHRELELRKVDVVLSSEFKRKFSRLAFALTKDIDVYFE